MKDRDNYTLFGFGSSVYLFGRRGITPKLAAVATTGMTLLYNIYKEGDKKGALAERNARAILHHINKEKVTKPQDKPLFGFSDKSLMFL